MNKYLRNGDHKLLFSTDRLTKFSVLLLNMLRNNLAQMIELLNGHSVPLKKLVVILAKILIKLKKFTVFLSILINWVDPHSPDTISIS